MPQKPTAPSVLGAHHVAYRCRDAEETRAFYEDLLGLKLATVVRDTAAETPFLHLFFELGDGNFIAFFDVGEESGPEAWRPKDGIRDYHYAMEVESREAMMAFKTRLEEAGVAVFGPVNHGFVHSIYFWDPNGIALEFTCRDVNYDAIIAEEGEGARATVANWMKAKPA
jgi:catechol 2,3-dioxygenase-like lactoylglutathione lyase family enzyme